MVEISTYLYVTCDTRAHKGSGLPLFFTIYFNLLKYGTHLNDMANPRTGEGPISSKANPEPRNPTINRGVLSFCNRKEGFFICYPFV